MEPTALLLLALSIVCSTARAVFSKKLGALSDSRRGFYLTQAVLFAVAAAVLLTLNVRSIALPSQTAVLLAVAYGVLTVLSQWMYTLSLTRCPVSVCAMVYSFGFILPTVFGTVVWREPVNAFKILPDACGRIRSAESSGCARTPCSAASACPFPYPKFRSTTSMEPACFACHSMPSSDSFVRSASS